MTELEEIIAHIEQTSEALDRNERALASSPDDRSLRITQASLEKRQNELNKRLERATALLHEPVAS